MFGYGDQVRIVEPHVFGVNTAGHEALSGWLRPGNSRADPEGGWRTYLSEGMREVQMLDETFAQPRPGYNPSDPRIVEIFCRLEAHVQPSKEQTRDAPGSHA